MTRRFLLRCSELGCGRKLPWLINSESLKKDYIAYCEEHLLKIVADVYYFVVNDGGGNRLWVVKGPSVGTMVDHPDARKYHIVTYSDVRRIKPDIFSRVNA